MDSWRTPVIIIGAGRSGTNMLRDILAQLPEFGTWPCDEINYIWRHGNKHEPTDEFPPDLATPDVCSYINRSFQRLSEKMNLSSIIEKTCSNSLRVGFVNQVFPNAKFIYIIRDGRDVVASSCKRWNAPLNLRYLLKKALFIPKGDLLYYFSRYFWNRMYRIFSKKERLAFWGPIFKEMDRILKNNTIEEVCAMQWKRCVDKAEIAFEKIESSRIHWVSYEAFVTNPVLEMDRLCVFVGVDITEKKKQALVQGVSKRNVGKWKRELDKNVLKRVNILIQDTLNRHGYKYENI